ncbi:MAG: HD domain-containing phosphohydrolase, partial [Bdellovibrionota bacterium]
RISHSGDELNLVRIEAFRKKGVNEFWLTKEDFSHYMQVNSAVIQAATKKGSVQFQESKRAKLIRHACQVAYENLKVAGIKEASVAAAEDIINHSLSVIDTSTHVEGILETIKGGGPSSYKHAASCALLCALMTKVMGWSTQKNITALVLGAFFHDIGMEEIPEAIREKDPRKLERQELATYQQHPTIGAQKLALIPNIPEEVIRIVAQHHENVNGQGYPLRLLRSGITPMARILALVNEFCEYLSFAGTTTKNGVQILNILLYEKPALDEKSTSFALEMVLTHPDIAKAKMEYSRETAKMVK